jgi:hypothetical protein
MIKTFRGRLASGGQDTIRLATNNGLTGYRILKFQGIGVEPGTTVMEHTVKLYKFEQDTINNAVDFDDQSLLAVCYINDNASRQLDLHNAVIFDSEIFNQDIFITCEDTAGDPVSAMNYYIELEQVTLDVGEAAVATLKDMRGSN